jgi:Putative phage abortive infection protein
MVSQEKDIDQEFDRLQAYEQNADEQIDSIEKKIRRFSLMGWVCVWLGWAIAIAGVAVYFVSSEGMEDLNLLGDFYGGSVASLWSLAALLFIFVAFLGQKQQLINQQREVRYNQFELRATRVELHRQREQLESQNLTLQKQRFENTFFQLINMHNSIVNDMDITSSSKESETGSDCFHVIYYEFRKFVKEGHTIRDYEGQEFMEKAWLDFYKQYESEIGHYIRNLYHILKFVNNACVEDWITYGKFIRSTLSSDELLVLFYNCHTMLGKDKFKPLIEKFNLFKNLPKEDLISIGHMNFYHQEAFADAD